MLTLELEAVAVEQVLQLFLSFFLSFIGFFATGLPNSALANDSYLSYVNSNNNNNNAGGNSHHSINRNAAMMHSGSNVISGYNDGGNNANANANSYHNYSQH
jgi:cell division protein FtsB